MFAGKRLTRADFKAKRRCVSNCKHPTVIDARLSYNIDETESNRTVLCTDQIGNLCFTLSLIVE